MFSCCYERNKSKKNNNSYIICLYCNKNIEKSNNIILKCGHIFHKNCYENFILKYELNILCPICILKKDYKIL